MTPAEVYELHEDEYDAFVEYMLEDARRAKRQARR
jgi:hypothetical protein